jgi:hypothetical protein
MPRGHHAAATVVDTQSRDRDMAACLWTEPPDERFAGCHGR